MSDQEFLTQRFEQDRRDARFALERVRRMQRQHADLRDFLRDVEMLARRANASMPSVEVAERLRVLGGRATHLLNEE